MTIVTDALQAGAYLDAGGAVINVKHPKYGAAGDGVTDDTTAVQAALDDAVGGTVYFPPGTYLHDQLSVSADTRVMGAGRGKSNLKLAPQHITAQNFGGALEIAGADALNPVTGVTIMGLTVDGSKGDHTYDMGINELDTEAIHFQFAERCLVLDVECVNAEDSGVDLDDCVGIVVMDYVGHGCGGYGVHVSLNSTRCRIICCEAFSNGTDHSRGGIDQHSSASETIYIGNLAHDNYRNYNIEGIAARWVQNISAGTTSQPDFFQPGEVYFAMPFGMPIVSPNSAGTDTYRLVHAADVGGADRVIVGSDAAALLLHSLGNVEVPSGVELEFLGIQESVIMRSGDGTRWRIRVQDDGSLVTDDLG